VARNEQDGREATRRDPQLEESVRPLLGDVRVVAELKRDALGVVEELAVFSAAGAEVSEPRLVRRVACGGRMPGSRLVARLLLARERAALGELAGVAGVPRLVEDRALQVVPQLDGLRPSARAVLVRTHLAGQPLSTAPSLPRDYFDLLDELLAELHRRGVCHNDLHKEPNVLVLADGRPGLIDFQLASRHVRRGRVFRARAHDDLRHVQKHRRRYTRDGRGPREAAVPERERMPRTRVSHLWRRYAKPVYVFVTRRLLGIRDGADAGRSPSGPWPYWTDPVGRAGGEDSP